MNAELAASFIRRIASPWSRTFSGISIEIIDDVASEVDKLLAEFEGGTTPLLEERAQGQVKLVQAELPGLLQGIVVRVHDVINKEQRKANRCLTPYIMEALATEYDRASSFSGRGSTVLRKVCDMRTNTDLSVIEVVGVGHIS